MASRDDARPGQKDAGRGLDWEAVLSPPYLRRVTAVQRRVGLGLRDQARRGEMVVVCAVARGVARAAVETDPFGRRVAHVELRAVATRIVCHCSRKEAHPLCERNRRDSFAGFNC